MSGQTSLYNRPETIFDGETDLTRRTFILADKYADAYAWRREEAEALDSMKADLRQLDRELKELRELIALAAKRNNDDQVQNTLAKASTKATRKRIEDAEARGEL